jgi:hypothetical protein
MKKTGLKIVTVCVMAVALLSACMLNRKVKGNKNVITKEIAISDYDRIEVSGGVNVEYSQSDESPSLQITLDENLFDYLDVQVKDKRLVIKPKEKSVNLAPTTFVVRSMSTALAEVKKAGSGKFTIVTGLTVDELQFKIAGSTKVVTEKAIHVNKLKIDAAGSSTMQLVGEVNEVRLEIAGSGRLDALDCEIRSLDCQIAGSGRISTFVTEHLSYEIAGSGTIEYKGNPSIEKQNVAGSGKVKKIN